MSSLLIICVFLSHLAFAPLLPHRSHDNRTGTLARQAELRSSDFAGQTPTADSARPAATEPISVDFTDTRWTITGPVNQRVEYLGRNSLRLTGNANLPDVAFEDGVIEVDLAVTGARGFVGMIFRAQSATNSENFYLRPHKTGLPDATQYTPNVNGSALWQLFSGPGFTSAVEIPPNRWVPLRIVVSGLEARVYFNNSPAPVLTIAELKHGYSRGFLGIYASGSGAHFSNFRYTPAPASATRPAPRPAAFAPGTIARWELSEAFPVAQRDPERLPSAAEMRAMSWQAVRAETPGMVVIDRYRPNTDGAVLPAEPTTAQRLEYLRGGQVVYARATIRSDRDQTVRMSFGYSDNAAVFLNSQPLFAGRSAFRFRDPGFLGIMDVENDTVFLPLRRGDNELVLAVAERMGGWGFSCRLDQMAGITLLPF